MSTLTGHQGGLLKSASARALAPLPVHRNDTGAKREQMPAGVQIPNMRHAIPPNEVCQRKWVREIIDRKGSVEEMLTTAVRRVADNHTEERLLEAQAIINELARTGEHSALLHKHVGAEQIRLLLGKGK
jgi:hypothetical protein